MTASSTPMSAGSRRCAGPGSSSGSTPTIGVSTKILRTALPPMMPGEIGSSTFAVLSTFDLERQIEADGATWLDRRLVGRGPADLVAAGFGQDVQQAMDRRREHLIGQGDVTRHADGRIFYRRNLLATLEQRDVIRAGTALAASRSLPFRATGDGETVQGVFKQTVQLSSGKFALVENVHEFTLVPWRSVIENRLGREVVGVVQGGSVSWQFGRNRGLGL